MVTLRSQEFGRAFIAPGALGFYGEGYKYQKFLRWLSGGYKGATFAGKTITAYERAGNMPLLTGDSWKKHIPREFKPRCIVVKPLSGHTLNAVGLSNPGVDWLLGGGRMGWFCGKDPIILSFMPVGATVEVRIKEANYFVDATLPQLHYLHGKKVALQYNCGCPNTEHGIAETAEEIPVIVTVLARLGIPLILNFSPAAPVELMTKMAELPEVDALWVANSIAWGTCSDLINWKHIFGSDVSPLKQRGFPDGGLSGPTCLPVTVEAVRLLRMAGVTKPIIAGNGVQKAHHVRTLYGIGADGIAVGIVGMLRPWRLRGIIKAAVEGPTNGYWPA
jgi:dihydroorotate dehydrogenase